MFFAQRGGGTRLGSRFNQVWASVTVSSLGDGMRFVALPLLAARLTADPRLITAVALAEQLPWLLFGLLSGVLADRIDRRRILWVDDALRAVLVGALALAAAARQVSIPMLIIVGFLLGCGQTVYTGAWSGMVPALVGSDVLTRANARIQVSVLSANNLLGTSLGAVLFGISLALPFTVDAASFALSSTVVRFLHGDFRPRRGARARPPVSLRRDTAEGIRWLWRQRLLRRLCLIAGVTDLVGAGLIAILVLYARRSLGLGDVGYALLVAAFAVGGIAGATLTPRLSTAIGPSRLLRLSTWGTAAAALGTGIAPTGPVAGLCIAGYGAMNLSWNVTAVSQRQVLAPTELLGRVTMAYRMVNGTTTALGTIIAGLMAHALGLRAPFLAGAALIAAAGLISTSPSTGTAQPTPAEARHST